jgi:acyl-CoA synthetase (AMP-forming)/AMP-acid ligase II
MRDRLGVPVVVRYTSTEASLGTGTVPGDPDHVVATTVGRPVPGVAMAIVDEDGRTVPEGEVGRVRLSSPAVMRGYWGGPLTGPGAGGVVYDREATRAVLADGWLTTGDFGFADTDGCLHLVGRANELYIRGGYNVYPAEVEGVLGSHPGVAQVAVVGAPDPVLGEIGVAFVVPSGVPPSDPPGLLEDLRALAPDRLVVAESLPLTSMMKVDKRALADRAAEAARSQPVRHAGAPPAVRPAEDRRQPANGAPWP